MPYAEIAVAIAAASLFYSAGEIGARDGGSNYAVLWAALSVLLSGVLVFVVKASATVLVFCQVGFFLAIGVIRGMRHG